MTTLLETPKTDNSNRSGSVRILRADMAAIMGEWALEAEPKALAETGSLLLRITSNTKRGPVTAHYRVTTIPGGYTLTKGDLFNGAWVDSGEMYVLDTGFGGGTVLCDCHDARQRMHDAKTGSQCKHRKACHTIGLCE